MDQHIIIVPDPDGEYFRLLPEKGYKLFSIAADRFVSEAVVKENQIKLFKAIEL